MTLQTYGPGNASLMKELNKQSVLNTLYWHGPLSRVEVSRSTGLTPPTVSLIVNEFLEQEIILEQGAAVGTRAGRRPVPLLVNPRAWFAVGLSLGVTQLRTLVTDLRGNVVAKRFLPVEQRPTADATIEAMAAEIRQAIADAGIEPRRVLGVGAGLHGLIDHAEGMITFAPHFGWRQVPVAAILEKLVKLPVLVDNGVRLMALGERWFGAGRDSDNFICVAVGGGIGSGLIINGRLYRGLGGLAGEIGHMTVDVDGPACSCGQYGCLEALASGPAIARRVARAVKQGATSLVTEMVQDLDQLTSLHVWSAGMQGDEVSIRAFEEAGTYLGIALANLVKALSPGKILIGGGVARAGDLLLNPLRSNLLQRAIGRVDPVPEVVVAALAGDGGPLGGAALVIDKLLLGRDPAVVAAG